MKSSFILLVAVNGITAALALWLVSADAVGANPPLPVISNQVFVVTNTAFAGGALGNGVSNSAAAINAAISFANSHGGGTVEIPAVAGGLTNYISGPITMANQVNLQVDSNAVLRMFPMSTWVSNYGSTTPFINASSLHDIEISGSGAIPSERGAAIGAGTMEGQGTNWWFPLASSRPNFLNIAGCTKVLIQNVRLQNPPTFTIFMKNSGGDSNVTINHITIDTPFDSHNTDAFDITGTNILIQSSYISTGDDDFELGGSGAVATDITISNCTIGTGHGLSIGSLTQGGINNVLVSNCTWVGTEYGIKMKTDRDRGGVIENLRYLDCTMSNVNFAFAFYEYYNTIGSPSKNFTNAIDVALGTTLQATNSTTPYFRNVIISNLTAVGNSGIQGPGNIAGVMLGLPEMPISNVTLYGVNILGRGSDGTVSLVNVKDIRIIDSNLTAPLTGTNVLTIYNAEITITNSMINPNRITLGGLARPPTNNVLRFFNSNSSITDTNLDGAGTFTLGSSTLSFTQSSVNFSNNLSVVTASTLVLTNGNNSHRGAFNGSGALTFNLPGSTVFSLQGNNSAFSGALTVSNTGTLLVNNTAGNGTGSGALTVLSSAKLGGTGVVAGPVTVNGTLAPGSSPGTLTVSNNLVVTGALQYELGTSSDRAIVTGNLTVGGTLNVTDAGGFADTNYTLFTYGGTLTYNGISIGSAPSGHIYAIDTNTAGQVKLIVTPPLTPFQQWQITYFGSTNSPSADANADPDGDGQNNAAEFQSGTDPTNSASLFGITAITKVSTNILVMWMTGVGKTNALERTAGAAGSYSNNFAAIFTATNTTGTTTNYLDIGAATNSPARYYRVRLVP